MYSRVKDLREDNNFTQKDIASILSVTPSGYAKIERGDHVLTADVLIQLSNVYHVSIDYLLSQTDFPYRIQK